MTAWKCPYCSGTIGSVPDLVGKTVACPYCLVSLTIPEPVKGESSLRRSGMRRMFVLFVGGIVAGVSLVWLTNSADLSQLRLPTVQLSSVTAEGSHAVRLARYDQSSAEPQQLHGNVGEHFASVPPVDSVVAGLGISRDRLIAVVSGKTYVEFFDSTPANADMPQISAIADGVEITLWGHPANLQTVTVNGALNSDNAAALLIGIVGELVPNWNIEEATNWLVKAVSACDTDMFVSTVCDGVEVTLMAAEQQGRHWVFFQPDRP